MEGWNMEEDKIITVYTKSTGSTVQLFDCNYQAADTGGSPDVEESICRYCAGESAGKNGHCKKMHINAMRESSEKGRPVIYRCDLGLMFWVCPIYSDRKFFGALRGSGFISNKSDLSFETGNSEKCGINCEAKSESYNNGIIPAEEFVKRVNSFPVCDEKKIESLSELLLVCAESLSTGSENNYRLLRLRCEQQANLSVLVNELKEKYPQGAELPGYPIEKERKLIDLIRQGRKPEAEKLLDEIFAMLVFISKDQFRYVQLRSTELAVLIARAGTNSGICTVTDNNTLPIKKIQEAKTPEELSVILHSLLNDITVRINSFQGLPHACAMRKAELYIRENLGRKMSLSEIAKVAGLSAPYFSSVFKNEMGENLSKYINRLRVEKAGKLLRETNLTLGEISGECCFEDQSWFSKIFKAYTGITPGKYRNQEAFISTGE